MNAMHVRLDRATLAESSAWVAGAISKNPPSPILAGMLIEAQDGLVSLTGFDYDTMRQATIAGSDTDQSGAVLVSGRFLVQIVAAMKGDVVELAHDGTQITITAGRSTYRARTMNPADYPALPKFPTHVGTIHADSLIDTLGIVEHAVAKDAIPSVAMTAFNICGSAGNLVVTGTDRFRLARAEAKWADASAATFETNVPGSALSSAVKGLSGEVQIGATDSLFGLSDETRVVVTRILGEEDKYPSVAPLFKAQPMVSVDVAVDPLVEALKRAVLVSDDRALVVLTFSDGLITVAADSDGSDGMEEVDCDPGFGEGEMAFKFNAMFLSQALLVSPTPTVRIGMTLPAKPVMIHPNGSDRCTMIVMPRGLAGA